MFLNFGNICLCHTIPSLGLSYKAGILEYLEIVWLPMTMSPYTCTTNAGLYENNNAYCAH